jgi:hypothetical protein
MSADGRDVPGPSARFLATLPLLLLLCPATVWAQGIRGVVLDAETNQPVNAVTVSLLDFREEVVRSVITDARGAFAIRVGETGRFYLRAERIGYASVTSRPLDLLPGDTAVVELRLGVEALAIEPLTVTASSRALHNRDLDDFYQRRRFARTGNAAFYGPEDFAQMPAAQIPDLLATAGGGTAIRVSHATQPVRPVIAMRGDFLNDCGPAIFVDGFQLNAEDNLNHYVTNMNVLAIEMYRGHAVPGELFICRDPRQCICGVINILTDRTSDGYDPSVDTKRPRILWATVAVLSILATVIVGR